MPPCPEAVMDLVSDATLAYARAVEAAGRELPPLRQEVTATDALTLACALLRSQNLNPYDLALWFSRGSVAR